MIEKLKDKNYVRAFGLMTPEEQECIRKAGPENCIAYLGGEWEHVYAFGNDYTYAIKPDYKPEPEFEKCEIKIRYFEENELVAKRENWTHAKAIDVLTRLTDFDHFEAIDNPVAALEDISPLFYRGKKPVAVFRKGQDERKSNS